MALTTNHLGRPGKDRPNRFQPDRAPKAEVEEPEEEPKPRPKRGRVTSA